MIDVLTEICWLCITIFDGRKRPHTYTTIEKMTYFASKCLIWVFQDAWCCIMRKRILVYPGVVELNMYYRMSLVLVTMYCDLLALAIERCGLCIQINSHWRIDVLGNSKLCSSPTLRLFSITLNKRKHTFAYHVLCV